MIVPVSLAGYTLPGLIAQALLFMPGARQRSTQSTFGVYPLFGHHRNPGLLLTAWTTIAALKPIESISVDTVSLSGGPCCRRR